MARESSTWKWLSGARRELGDVLHITRQENLVAFGGPDVEGCNAGIQFWLELKVAPRPAKPSTLLTYGSALKDNQVEWAEARWAAGGNVGVLIQVGEGSERRVYLIPGCDARSLQDRHTEAWHAERSAIRFTRPTAVEVIAAACHIREEIKP